MTLQRCLMEKNEMVRFILKVEYCRVSILYVNPEIIKLPKTIILPPFIFWNSFKIHPDKYQSLLDVFYFGFLLNFQITVFQSKIFLDQLNDRVINCREFFPFDFERPFAFRWEYWSSLIFLRNLLGVSFENSFPIVKTFLLDFNYTDLRGFVLHHVFLFLRHWIWFEIIKLKFIISILWKKILCNDYTVFFCIFFGE